MSATFFQNHVPNSKMKKRRAISPKLRFHLSILADG
jgi:hypothetical protein